MENPQKKKTQANYTKEEHFVTDDVSQDKLWKELKWNPMK